jgi:hypothetical protein
MSVQSKPSDRRKLRRFGLTVAIGFTLIGSLSWWRGHTVAPATLWGVAALMIVPTLVAPMLLAPVERAWLTVGEWLGWINTRIILTALFYVILTPVAVVMRLFRDPLDRRLHEGTSYWNRRPARPFDADDYLRQF